MYVKFFKTCGSEADVYLLGKHVGKLIKSSKYQSTSWALQVDGEFVNFSGHTWYALHTIKLIAKKHFTQKLAESTAPLTRHAVIAVNRAFREADESHKWPIFDNFNATERAIRRLRRQRQHVEFTYVIEYMAALESEISSIVNNEV